VFSERNGLLVDRYVDVVGRVSALVIGTLSVEMLLSGIDLWLSTGKTGPAPLH
jgi:multiple antibiotic resistance protein